MSLRTEVEKILPEWERWYGNLFDAAVDLGVIRARVCDPSSLLLSNRHRAVREAAEQAAAMVHRSYRRDLVPVDRRHHLVVWHPERPE